MGQVGNWNTPSIDIDRSKARFEDAQLSVFACGKSGVPFRMRESTTSFLQIVYITSEVFTTPSGETSLAYLNSFMKSTVLRVLLLGALLCGFEFTGSAQASVNSREKIQALSGTIYISRPADSIGSGFVFGPRREIVTCDHVVDVAVKQGQVTNMFLMIDRKVVKLKLKARFPKSDLAVLTSETEIPGDSFKIGDFKKIHPGSMVVYSGYDKQALSTNSAQQTVTVVSLTHVAQITSTGSELTDGGSADFLEFPGEGVPGYSGGPVFNEDGELVAIMREAWFMQPVHGGQSVLLNRAFSLEPLTQTNQQFK